MRLNKEIKFFQVLHNKSLEKHFLGLSKDFHRPRVLRGFLRTYRYSILVAKNDWRSSGLEGGVNLTVDGGVQKKLLKEGSGDSVKSGSRVAVHYTGYLDSGLEFDSTRKRQEPFLFVVDKGQVIRGWDIALLSMKEGETARVRCSPSYAYGEKGVPPSIPPNAFLTFEIQVVKVERFSDVPSTNKDSSTKKSTTKIASKPKDERKPVLERFYFISPFASQTGERAPWWLNPIITFSIIFISVAIAFTIVVQNGALHTSYLKNM
ncbi:FK56-binding protein 1 [Galdieria sulphuraria]|uniref:peptidylprolyl isomerase n=1 Tax=Galdieria sulphuraria TaxID=130081 RepID=M2X0U8_GALSU|nr:FK56-binding protein 1 [Galdieria sulphuraria]EME29975.1 FK56-binding protein 1 [Galdieria sulphuraria]|eukprot:XP_005706495.1 FK56-binding protein 1 [Galdieria sulphuraria]